MESRKNPNLVIPEYPIITNEKKKKKIKLDYALMRPRTLFSAVEAKALGKVEEGLSRAFTVAQASEARYIVITEGDTWRLYDTSKPITEA
jgi:predicted type IV restriction endonuclease